MQQKWVYCIQVHNNKYKKLSRRYNAEISNTAVGIVYLIIKALKKELMLDDGCATDMIGKFRSLNTRSYFKLYLHETINH